MAADDLDKPLGTGDAKKSRLPKLPFALPTPAKLVAGVMVLAVVSFGGLVAMANNPLGGEPVFIADINTRTKATTPKDKVQADATASQTGPEGMVKDRRTINIIDGSSGQSRQVALMTPAESSVGLDPRISDGGKAGVLPRIASDGTRPLDVYARPYIPESAAQANLPRIAIVIGGLGISNQTTSEAITRLPGAVSLAFAPYGDDLERQAGQARAEGREILLHLPMEPFDYPDNDPGPKTLLASLGTEQNLERLHWSMQRLSGYAGVMTYMGAKFTATESAVAPIIADLGKRGLLVVDEGSSARSLIPQVGAISKTPVVKGDQMIDRVPTPAAIDATLAVLEATAKERGYAVGVGTALPVTIEKVAQWSATLEKKGIVLVPVTSLAPKKVATKAP